MVLRYDSNLITQHDKIDKNSSSESSNGSRYWIQYSSYSIGSRVVFPCLLLSSPRADIDKIRALIFYSTTTFSGYNQILGYTAYKYLQDIFNFISKTFNKIEYLGIEYDPRLTKTIYATLQQWTLQYIQYTDGVHGDFSIITEDKKCNSFKIEYTSGMKDLNLREVFNLLDSFILRFKMDGNENYLVITYFNRSGSSTRYEPWVFSIKKESYDRIKKELEKEGDLNFDFKFKDYSESLV